MTPIWAWARRELTRHRRAALALGAADRRQRRGGAHDRRRCPPQRHPPTTASSRRATRPTSGCSTGTRKAARPGAGRRGPRGAASRSGGGQGGAPVHHRGVRRGDSDYDLGIFAGPDPALFTEIDEPRILEGRRPDPSEPHEALINRFTQEDLGVEVGDTVTSARSAPSSSAWTRTSSNRRRAPRSRWRSWASR